MIDTGQNPARVVVVQDLGFAYHDAENFGKLEFLLPANESPENYMRVASIIRKRLWDLAFSPRDYLLCSGAPSVLMQAAVEAKALCRSEGFFVLQWDRDIRGYLQRRVL